MMTEKAFTELVKNTVKDYVNESLDKTDKVKITTDDVYIVTQTYILGHLKALASTTLPDGMYYECTWNDVAEELYFDAYKKWENRCIKPNKVCQQATRVTTIIHDNTGNEPIPDPFQNSHGEPFVSVT